jgi:hypothetical protein
VSYHSGIAPGSVSKYATITYVDTSTEAKRITLYAQVVPNVDTAFQVELSTSTLDFTVTKGEKPKEKKLYLKNTGGEEYKVYLIDYPEDYFKIKLGKKLKPGKSLRVQIKPGKDLPEEGIRRSFTLELEGKEKTKITVPLVYQGAATTAQRK